MSSLVSIIVPTYNFGAYIAECVGSLLNQTYKNIEIIVVNDGSTDNTLSILQVLSDNHPNIKIINKCNEGVSKARNDGIELAKGEYITFVDGDDYVAPTYVEYLVSLIVQYDADMALSLNCYTRKGEPDVSEDCIHCISGNEGVELLMSPRVIVGCWNKIYRKTTLEKYNIHFNPSLFYGEGLHFITRLANKSKSIAIGTRKVYYYRRNNYSSATSNFDIDKFVNGEEAINKIFEEVEINTPQIRRMASWHLAQFRMGTIVRILSANKKSQYMNLYNTSYRGMLKSVISNIIQWDVPLYNKLILVGSCISPSLMAFLDRMRRSNIAKHSVADIQLSD